MRFYKIINILRVFLFVFLRLIHELSISPKETDISFLYQLFLSLIGGYLCFNGSWVRIKTPRKILFCLGVLNHCCRFFLSINSWHFLLGKRLVGSIFIFRDFKESHACRLIKNGSTLFSVLNILSS